MGAFCPPASTLCVQLSKISIWCYKIKLVKYNTLKTNKFTFINIVSKILTKTLCIQRNVREENLKAIQLTKKFVNGYQTPICISLNNLVFEPSLKTRTEVIVFIYSFTV
jgi:hypothetical protein